MKLSTYAKTLGLHYQTLWRHFHKGLIPGAYCLPTGTIIVPDATVYKETTLPKSHNGKFKHKDPISVTNPDLSSEWHPTRNSLSPSDLTAGSSKKVWWQCGKGHEWEARISSRTHIYHGHSKPYGCPYCRNLKIDSANSLLTINPILAKEWHPTKNSFTPDMVAPSSGKKAWWRCSNGHEWIAQISSRAQGVGCDQCNPKVSVLEVRIYSEIKGLFKDAVAQKKIYGKECDIWIPSLNLGIEVDGWYWHQNSLTKEEDKNLCIENSGAQLIRVRQEGLMKIRPHDIFHSRMDHPKKIVNDLISAICNLRPDIHQLQDCLKYQSNPQYCNEQLFNIMSVNLCAPEPGQSLADLYPEVASQWHPTKNGSMLPSQIKPSNTRKFWWICKNKHEWLAPIYSRTNGNGCPYCSGHKVCLDNCLATVNPS